MRTIAHAAVLLLLIAGCSPSTAPTLPAGPATPADAGPAVVELVASTDALRDSLGLPALAWHPALAGAAREHAEDMRRRSYLSHVTPEGLDLAARLAAAGIAYQSAGENLAAGPPDAAAVLAGWLASPEHRATIESAEWSHAGAAEVDGVWVHLFLRVPGGDELSTSARVEPQRTQVRGQVRHAGERHAARSGR